MSIRPGRGAGLRHLKRRLVGPVKVFFEAAVDPGDQTVRQAEAVRLLRQVRIVAFDMCQYPAGDIRVKFDLPIADGNVIQVLHYERVAAGNSARHDAGGKKAQFFKIFRRF